MENARSVTKKQRPAKKTRSENLSTQRNTRQSGTLQTDAIQPAIRQARGKQATTATTTTGHSKNKHSVLGIELNANTARSAIILSEIIGPPLSRRQKRR